MLSIIAAVIAVNLIIGIFCVAVIQPPVVVVHGPLQGPNADGSPLDSKRKE